jgi:hypothetical protein
MLRTILVRWLFRRGDPRVASGALGAGTFVGVVVEAVLELYVVLG